MRLLAVLTMLSTAAALGQIATPPTIEANASLVLVPTEVHAKSGELLYGLTAGDFRLEDNGVPQILHLDDTDVQQSLVLVVVVQCSRDAHRDSAHIEKLSTMVDDLVGAASRRVAVVSFGDAPTLLQSFTSDSAQLDQAFAEVKPCREQDKNVILDAVEYAEQLLNEEQTANSRRAILLISETRDHGSETSSADVIAELGRSNIVVESMSYGPAKSQLVYELTDPGRNVILHGQMNLVPLFAMSREALRQNVPHTLTQLSGGQYVNFTTSKGFEKGMHDLTNTLHNEYRLSFQPASSTSPGLHRLSITIPSHPDAVIRARLIYVANDIPHPR